MTVLEMHTAVELGLDKSASFQIAAFEPEDIDYWLNEAQTELVKRKIFGNNPRGEWYDGSVKRMEDLTTILKTAAVSSLGSHPMYPNVYTVDTTALDSNYMFFVDAVCEEADGDKEETQLVKISQIKNLIETERNKPYLRNPYVFLQGNNVNIIRDPFKTYTNVHVTYVERPLTLVRENPVANVSTTTSVLPEQVHPEIVALTVLLMLENIESQRLQSNLITFNTKE